jgi:hypothetical protein
MGHPIGTISHWTKAGNRLAMTYINDVPRFKVGIIHVILVYPFILFLILTIRYTLKRYQRSF